MLNTLFSWLDSRSAGVLLHPTSLPGDLGIGKLGREAKRFIDFLQVAGFKSWQMCPLGPTGYGDSPYQCFSAFAGNPYLIDLHPLVGFGLLSDDDLAPLRRLPHDRVDYGELYVRFWPVMAKAFAAFDANSAGLPGYGDFAEFCQKHADWLDAYAAFSACKDHFGGQPWNTWPKELRSYRLFQKSSLYAELKDAMNAVRFVQYLFFGQWTTLRSYAQEKNINIIGDVPIFVAYDSADVWANAELFQLDKNGSPKVVAGCPPDYFSPLGQFWGNPIFDWKAMKQDGYAWWMRRMAANFALFDIVRLDHFRGFEAYWAIPAQDEDARGGAWKPGPGIDFFKVLQEQFPEAKLIAEDLGEITDEVRELLKLSGLPGMAILQFAFGDDSSNLYLPHNVSPNSVIYPGTHDNDTTLGWYNSVDETARDHFRRYYSVDGSVPQWDMIRSAYASVSKLAVIPMQDMLNLGSDARMNFPGEAAGNWQWRYRSEQLDTLWRESAAYLRSLGEIYYRP